MKYSWILFLAVLSIVFAQRGVFAQSEGSAQVSGSAGGNVFFAQGIAPLPPGGSVPDGPGPVTIGAALVGGMDGGGAIVLGAPYSATVTNQSVQTLADGNRIVHSSTGTIARDSEGRTRRDLPVPALSGLAATYAPHFVMIQDPVAQTSYLLNLTDKTAQRLPLPPPLEGLSSRAVTIAAGAGAPPEGPIFIQRGDVNGEAPPPPPLPPPPGAATTQQAVVIRNNDKAQVASEDLGTQTMEGISVTGTRSTRTIPAGEIGNDKAIEIVTEVWTSPDLHTIVSSKRSDPRTGEQTFQLSGISRNAPDASLFTVPSDFKIMDTPQTIQYRQAP